jgi:hypothetical protein
LSFIEVPPGRDPVGERGAVSLTTEGKAASRSGPAV